MKEGKLVILAAVGGMIAGVGMGMLGMGRIIGKIVARTPDTSDKFSELYQMMSQWVKVKQEGRNLSAYFRNKGYNTIAVYGMSSVGIRLLEEMKDTGIQVLYGIDRNADNIYADVKVVRPEDFLDKVDVVVVTAVASFEEIERSLSERIDCPIVSLKEILRKM